MQTAFLSASPLLYQLQPLFLIPAITLFFSFLHQIQRRSSNIQVSLFNNRSHMPEKQSHNQSSNMRTIHVGIGHNNDFMVTNFAQIYIHTVIIRSRSNPQSFEYHDNFIALIHPVTHRLFHIQNLTPKWQDSLKLAVTSLFCRSACRISLHQKYLTIFSIIISTIGQFTGESRTRKHRFALHHIPGFPGSMAGSSSQYHFIYNGFCIFRMLLQIIRQSSTYCL